MEHDDDSVSQAKANAEGLPGPSQPAAESPAAALGEELPPGMERFQFPELTGTAATTETASLDLLGNVELDVRIDLGHAYMRLEDALRLGPGAVVPLDRSVDEPVDVFAGGRLIARGEILVLDDHFGVRVTELVTGIVAV